MRSYNNQEGHLQDNEKIVNQCSGQRFENETIVQKDNLDDKFINAIEKDGFENHFDESQLQEEDPKKEEEDLYEDEIEEPETFEEDGYKID